MFVEGHCDWNKQIARKATLGERYEESAPAEMETAAQFIS
jgi:hypothetical protein